MKKSSFSCPQWALIACSSSSKKGTCYIFKSMLAWQVILSLSKAFFRLLYHGDFLGTVSLLCLEEAA